MKYLFLVIFSILLSGCFWVGHSGFIHYENELLGGKLMHNKPFKYKNAGKLRRSDFLIQGYGLTHITKDKDGNLIYHWFGDEVLPNKDDDSNFKKLIGKCKTYYVVDPKTLIVKSWGFDKGGNPLSCQVWP